MEAFSEAAVRLASRLRELREREFSEVTLTQVQLAQALGADRRVAPATLSSWENVNNPKTPPTSRLTAYARFFATRKSVDDDKPHLVPDDQLDDRERSRFEDLEEELLDLHAAIGDEPPARVPGRRLLLQFDDPGPIVIVCPELPTDKQGDLGKMEDPNYTRLHRYGDADAFLDVFGHIRAMNPHSTVRHRLPSDTHKSDLQNHLVTLGGIGWNSTLRAIQREMGDLPITQIEDPELPTGEVFLVRDPQTGEETTYYPVAEEGASGREFTEDVGLIARIVNPFNSSRTLTLFNGVHSTGVVGAVLAITEETVRLANEEFLAARYPAGEFAMLVRVRIVGGDALAPDLNNPRTRLFEWSPADSAARS